jgi:hypothetical protein
MPVKVFVSKADRHTVLVDGETLAMVKNFAHRNRCTITAAVYVLLARALTMDAGGDPNKIQLPHNPPIGTNNP